MVVLLVLPREYFDAATFASTSCMILVSYALGLRWARRPSVRGLTAGVGMAVILYLVFAAGNLGINTIRPFGISSSSASSIYSLIASPSNPLPLQAAVLLFDAAGFESFFRGTVQSRLRTKLGAGAAPLVAAADAAIHSVTLNPLWVLATFIVDLGWGMTYHYTKELSASFTSHLVWDVMIFLVLPLG
jgi:membrane protease YdiL (CAAX protease family)